MEHHCQVNTTYEPYSQEPEYIETNRELLKKISLGSVCKVLDLACGTGLLTDLILELKPDLAVYGIDISRESLEIGRRKLQHKGLLASDRASWERAIGSDQGIVMFAEGSADHLDFESNYFDLAMMGNAIHLMPSKDKFLQEVRRVLAPRGIFIFNSVFFVGTFAEGTEAVFAEWMKESINILNSKNQELREAGKPPIPRKRGMVGRAFNKGWLSPMEWEEVLSRNGFEVTDNCKRLVPISQRGLELVGAYGGLAEVLMSGYPIEIASECLQKAVSHVFSNFGIMEIPRYWLEVTAIKSS